jgi:hypothetical protein
MKGIELFASVISLLFLIGISAMLGGVVIIALNLVDAPTTQTIDYEMQMSSVYPPIKLQTAMLSYLELTDVSGFKIKEILSYAAMQENIDSVLIDGKYVTTLGTTTSDSIKRWFPDSSFIVTLNINGRVILIADNMLSSRSVQSAVLTLKHVSVPIFIDSQSINEYSESPSAKIDFYVQ